MFENKISCMSTNSDESPKEIMCTSDNLQNKNGTANNCKAETNNGMPTIISIKLKQSWDQNEKKGRRTGKADLVKPSQQNLRKSV